MEAVTKYFLGLKELRSILKYTDKVALTKIAKEFKLNPYFSKVLLDGKIINRIDDGSNDNDRRYSWNTIEPNLAMAKKVLENCLSEVKQSGDSKKVVKVVKRKPKQKVKGSTWSKADTEFLLENNGKLTRDEIAKKLGRTKKALQNKLTMTLGSSKPINEVATSKVKEVVETIVVEPRTINKEVKQLRTISIFWGMIKITR